MFVFVFVISVYFQLLWNVFRIFKIEKVWITLNLYQKPNVMIRVFMSNIYKKKFDKIHKNKNKKHTTL